MNFNQLFFIIEWPLLVWWLSSTKSSTMLFYQLCNDGFWMHLFTSVRKRRKNEICKLTGRHCDGKRTLEHMEFAWSCLFYCLFFFYSVRVLYYIQLSYVIQVLLFCFFLFILFKFFLFCSLFYSRSLFYFVIYSIFYCIQVLYYVIPSIQVLYSVIYPI